MAGPSAKPFTVYDKNSDAEYEHAKTIKEESLVVGDNRHDGQNSDFGVEEKTTTTDNIWTSFHGEFTCKECGEEFEIESKLRAHMMLHSEDKVYKCQFCYKLFSKRSNLSSHLRIHTGEKPFRCKICLNTFAWMHSVRTHVARVHKVDKELIENFIGKEEHCNGDCGQADASELNNEEANVALSEGNGKERNEDDVEDNETQVDAEYKDMENYITKTQIFKSKSESNISDDNQKFLEKRKVTYICKHCSKEVSQRSNMIDHVRSHLGFKRFKCKLCGKDLSRKQNIVHHLKYVHFINNSSINDMIIQNDEAIPPKVNEKKLNTAKADSMDLGTVQFGENYELKEKQINDKVHKADMFLNNVHKDYKQNSDEDLCNENDMFLSTKNEKCADDKTNSSIIADGTHTDFGEVKYEVLEGDTPAEKRYLCKICGFICDRRYYMTNQHIMKHTGAKRYRCVICCKSYTRKFVFRRHVLKEHNIRDEELDSIFDASEIDKKKKQPPRNSSLSNKRTDSRPVSIETNSVNENDANFGKIPSGNIKGKNVENDDKSFDDESCDTVEVEINGDYPKTELEFSFTTVPVENPNKFVYKCNLCGFVCTRKYYMVNMHYLKHTGGKPYLCVVCCKLYSRRYVLRKHIIKEHGIRGDELEELLETTGKRLNPTDGLPEAISHSDMKVDLSHGRESDKLKNGESCSAELETLQKLDAVERKPTKEVLESVVESLESHSSVGINKEKIGNKTDYINLHSDDAALVDTDFDRNKRAASGETHFTELPEKRKKSDIETSMQDDVNDDYISQRKNKTSKNYQNNESAEQLDQTLNSKFDCYDHTANGKQSKGPKKFDYPFEQVIRSFMDLKTLTCLKCNKKCTKKSNLKQHIRILHFNLKEYSCQECNKTFNTKYNLKVHMKQHLQPEDRDSMNQECYICKKAFTTKSYLKVHLTKYHSVKFESSHQNIPSELEHFYENTMEIPFDNDNGQTD